MPKGTTAGPGLELGTSGMEVRGSILTARPRQLLTNVSQIYGCFFPQDLVRGHFINLYLTMVFQYPGTTLLTLVVAMSDKISGCQEQPLLKWYA